MDEKLKQYLTECKNKKLSWEQVEYVLAGSNYPEETIVEAKTWYTTSTVIAEPDTPVKSVNEIKPKKKFGIFGWIFVLILIFGLLGGGSYGAIYMVGTKKLTIPNQSLQTVAEKLSLTMPGVPRNPKLILDMVEEAHKRVSKSSFEISMSGQLDSSEIETLLGSKAIDLQIKGFSDVTNTLDPKFSLNLMFGKELDVDIRKPDKMMYVKINKTPVSLYALLGMNPVKIKPLWENWIGVDVSKPDTDAKKLLENNLGSQMNNIQPSEFIDFTTAKISEDTKSGIPAYKLEYKIGSEQLNRFENKFSEPGQKSTSKLSDTIKNIDVVSWIDKSNLMIVESNVLATVDMENYSGSKEVKIAIVMKFGDFGRDVSIVKPDKYLSPEEFLSEFMKLEPEGLLTSINPQRQFAQSRNIKRMSDINALLNSVNLYNADNKNGLMTKIPVLPTEISKNGVDICSVLVPSYLAALPTDPKLNSQVIYDCNNSYTTGYSINKDSSGKITVSAPSAENGEMISVTR